MCKERFTVGKITLRSTYQHMACGPESVLLGNYIEPAKPCWLCYNLMVRCDCNNNYQVCRWSTIQAIDKSNLWQWSLPLQSCSCVAIDNAAQIFLRPTSLWFSQKDWTKMQQLKPSSFIIGLPVILLRISASSAALDALATHGMRVGCMDYPAAELFTDRHFEHSVYYCNKIYSFMLLILCFITCDVANLACDLFKIAYFAL